MDDPEIKVKLLVSNVINSSKKGSRTACLPILRSLTSFAVECAPGPQIIAIFEALIKRTVASAIVLCGILLRCTGYSHVLFEKRSLLTLCPLFSVAAALKSSSGNSEENKVIRVVHYFMTRLARAAPGALVEVLSFFP